MNSIENSKHIRCVLSNCKSGILRDKNLLRLYTREFCKELRIGSICSSHFLYNPYGLTIVVLIEDGEIILKSIYESNIICIDIFTLLNDIDIKGAVKYFEKVSKSSTCKVEENVFLKNRRSINLINNQYDDFEYRRDIKWQEKLNITILGSSGGVAKSILSILNKAINDENDPIHHKICNLSLHLVDLNQKDIKYYKTYCPNLIDIIKLYEFSSDNSSKLINHLKKTDTDILIDVSYADTVDTLRICNKYGVIYINTALESISVDNNQYYAGFGLQERYKILESHRDEFQNTTAILCSGMNPGIVQWMAYEVMKRNSKKIPKGCYIVEDDTSFFEDESLAKKGTIYTTWYPEGFLDEAIYSYPTFMKNNESIFLYKKVYELEFKVTLDKKVFYGCLMPHEEAITLGKMYNMETGFIYKVNDHTTNLIKSYLDNIDKLWSQPMEVLDPEKAVLKGEDLVGVLLVYENKEVFMYNALSNKDIYEKYKTNATYHQVASGVYGALASILNDNIPQGIYYIEQLLEKCNSNYGKYLSYHLGECIIGENNNSDGNLLNRMREINKNS